MPSPNRIETPSGNHEPHGSEKFESGKPSNRPITNPMTNPSTDATNSAVDSSSTRRTSHVAGTTVRYGRIAKPTTTQATTHAASRAPA